MATAARRAALAIGWAAVGCRAGAQEARPALAWRVVAEVPLPGKAARFDYQSLDAAAGRLWIAHMGADEVLAVDLGTRRVAARVRGLPGVTGVLVVPALGRVFASLSATRQLAVLDIRSGEVLARVAGGRFPDGLAYAPGAHRLFVSDESGHQELVVDASSVRAETPIRLGGQAGNTQYDSGSGRIWVAVQTPDELVAIDPVTAAVVERVAVPGIERPHGFVLDPGRRCLYVSGEGNARVGVLDLRTHRMRHTYPVGDGPDVLALDAERRRLFVAAESGVISAFGTDGDSLVPLGRYQARAAHSVAVDPSNGLIYVPVADVGRPVLRILALE
jgi:DNA-binding beta-propeller fold protein YncE